MNRTIIRPAGALGAVLILAGLVPGSAFADEDGRDNRGRASCQGLPSQGELTVALWSAVASDSTGLNNDMWATVVNEFGVVCAVTFSGGDNRAQWPLSRVISAQKANTANGLSLSMGDGGLVPGLALSTANLYAGVQPGGAMNGMPQPGGSLFGLQFSNPVDPEVAYRGNPKRFGEPNDPMVGLKIGGVNVFGGGLALYDENGNVVGALGVSGDTSCRDHIVAWITRDGLALDTVPAGVSPTGDDNMILFGSGGNEAFAHPSCGFGEDPVIQALPTNFPIGSNP